MGLRLINSIVLPHICLAQKNITDIQRGKITQYLILEGLDVVGQVAQILRRLLTRNTSTSSRGATPFKVQINFDIHIFEGQRDVDVIDKGLNLIEGHLFFHNFSNRENIIFALLKIILHVKYWWDTFCEKKEIDGSTLFVVSPT
jgi:hypothetical protein